MFTPLVVDIRNVPYPDFRNIREDLHRTGKFRQRSHSHPRQRSVVSLWWRRSSCRWPGSGTDVPALVDFPNNGNLGLPLAAYAFGEEGLGYAIVFYAICMIGQFTVGQAIAAGSANWRGIARLPLIYAVLLGVGVSVWHVALPRWFTNTISLIGGMTIPLMLLMLGASLARLRVVTISRSIMLSALRIGAGAGIGLVIAALFHLDATARSVLIMQCAMPVAVTTIISSPRNGTTSRRRWRAWWSSLPSCQR